MENHTNNDSYSIKKIFGIISPFHSRDRIFMTWWIFLESTERERSEICGRTSRFRLKRHEAGVIEEPGKSVKSNIRSYHWLQHQQNQRLQLKRKILCSRLSCPASSSLGYKKFFSDSKRGLILVLMESISPLLPSRLSLY
jgi:hypothetical protein